MEIDQRPANSPSKEECRHHQGVSGLRCAAHAKLGTKALQTNVLLSYQYFSSSL
jgi:hypothetical protein